MENHLADIEALLERTPAVLQALIGGLPESWTRSNEGDGTWSAYDVVGHLRHCEQTDWMPRVRLILEHGERRTFTPLDRWAQAKENANQPLAHRIEDFARLRAANLAELQALQLCPADLERRGRHPALGVVTLGQLLATWPAHDLTHLHQISRVLAHQCRAAVGPWSRFLGVLSCDAHSASA